MTLYSDEEVMLCVYAARFDHNDIGRISAIREVNGRSEQSVRRKIWNIRNSINRFTNRNFMPPSSYRGVDIEQIYPFMQIERRKLWELCNNYLCSQGIM